MNIVFFCKRYYTNKDLIEDRFGRLFHLPVELARLGNNVTVFAIDYRNTIATEQNIGGVLFVTLPCALLSLFTFFFRTQKKISELKAHLIIASGDSHIGYIGYKISEKINIPFVFDVYDYYPAFKGNCIPGMRTMFSVAVKKAGLVLVASNSLKIKINFLNNNVVLVENGVDPKVFRPHAMKTARSQLNIKKEVAVIGYFGSITPSRGPLLIEACQFLRQLDVDVCLLLAGRIGNVELDFPWVVYKGEVAQEQIPYLIAACDVVTLPYAADKFNSHCGACKIAEYIYCEKPIVATNVSDHDQIFKEASASVCVPDAKALAIAIATQLKGKNIVRKPERYLWAKIASLLLVELAVMVGY